MHDLAAHHNMLGLCDAFIIADGPAQNASLLRLAAKAGFRQSEPVNTVSEHHESAIEVPIKFFLVHYQVEDHAKAALLKHIRQSQDINIRLSPVILFIDDCAVQEILRHIEMGFDDVISLPENAEVLNSRLINQISADHIFIETSAYLGPDRRRMELTEQPPDNRRTGDHSHRRLTIHRDPRLGVSIRQTTIFATR